ncbi:MAG: hypothetical protein Q9166_000540 [cf. Caloplaca sp. 2 TL-2023]
MDNPLSISSLLNSTLRNLKVLCYAVKYFVNFSFANFVVHKRSHDQMSSGSSNHSTTSQQPPSSTASATTSSRSLFNSFPSFGMPNLPNLPGLRFAGDGYDFRRPAPAPAAHDVIDLTEDYSPEIQRQARPTAGANTSSSGSQTNSTRHAFRDLIDIDEESAWATVGSSSESPDLELLAVRSIRSQNTSDTEPRRRTEARPTRPRSILRPPGSSHTDNRPFGLGGWGALRQHAQGHRAQHTAQQFNRLLHSNHHHTHAPADVLLMHEGRGDIILPGDLDFVSQGFRMGDVTATRQAQPPLPTYDAPSPARQGFTRSPKEEDVLVCPNCEDELGTGKDDTKRQVWVVKACGHVRKPCLLLRMTADQL